MTKDEIELNIKDCQDQVEKCARNVEKYRAKKLKDIKNKDLWRIYFNKWLEAELYWRSQEMEYITQLKEIK